MDGGVAPDTTAACKQAGADVLVAGSAIFGHEDRAKQIRAIREG
jgi:ribulose-phosphate 3-epimerase